MSLSLTAQLQSTKPELRFCAGSNLACGMVEIYCDGEYLWQWTQLEIRLNAFHQSTISQNNSSSCGLLDLILILMLWIVGNLLFLKTKQLYIMQFN